MNRFLIGLVLILSVVSGESCFAHKPSDSYLKIRANGELMTVQWDIALKDLDFQIGLDENQNGEITWGEVKNRRDAIAAHALSHLSINADGNKVGLTLSDLLIAQHSDGAYAALMLETDSPSNAKVLEVKYGLFFDVDPTHRGLVLFEGEQVTSTYVLSPNEPTATVSTSESGMVRSLLQFIREGVWHIWIGFDHILFLIALLLPAVFIRSNNEWDPVEKFRPAWKAVLKIVTLFTIAHSITLWLAVMEYVTLPSNWVEATIAFSIIVTVANNLYPVIKLPAWVIAFAFGLVHGFGFANVLIDLGLNSVTLAISLLGFNVGVELGQIAIVVVFLPIAFLTRETWFYRNVVFTLGSVIIGVIAVIWFVERVGNFEILGF